MQARVGFIPRGSTTISAGSFDNVALKQVLCKKYGVGKKLSQLAWLKPLNEMLQKKKMQESSCKGNFHQ